MATLKPCPFDGSVNLVGAVVNSKKDDGSIVWWSQDIDKCLADPKSLGEFAIFCKDCHTHGPETAEGGTMAEAVELWNKRADPVCDCGKPLSKGLCRICDNDE